MIFFCLSLFTLTFAFSYNGTYIECFDHDDCERNYGDTNKIYCYVGTCTYKCPPGYEEKNTERDWNFECVCNASKGLISNGNFGEPFTNLSIPKCKCDRPFCFVNVYATGIGYTDGLIPYGAPPNCKILEDAIPQVLTQFSFYLVLATMIIFMFIHCRSASGVVYDFHRYYGLYVLGSTLVIVFVQSVQPFSAGFTRTMGFGIVAHNSAEWNLLLRLQYGKTSHTRNSTNICLIMYYIIMLLAMSVLRLDYLLYFSMIQGGFLDWTFVCFMCAAHNTIDDNETHDSVLNECCKDGYSRFACWYGTGALFHLLSVEILFAGFILNNAKLIGLGGFFLLPMFLFYTIWVFGQENLMVFCGPGVFMNYIRDVSDSVPTKFLIVPFKHTTRTVDILWKRLVGEGYAPISRDDVEMEPVNMSVVKSVGDNSNIRLTDVDLTGQVLSGMSRSSNFEVEDCEDFKFGIDDKCCCCKCPRITCCCGRCWIPLYWVGALICISVNTGILIMLPDWISAKECNDGYYYGAW